MWRRKRVGLDSNDPIRLDWNSHRSKTISAREFLPKDALTVTRRKQQSAAALPATSTISSTFTNPLPRLGRYMTIRATSL